MKKFIILVCLLFAFSLLGGCKNRENNLELPPVVDSIPDVNTPENDDAENSPETETPDDEQEKRKRLYAVSTASSLRVRSLPNSNSKVVGYLDKNDAVLITQSEGEYFKTVYKEQTAYVYAPYCKIMEIDAENQSVEDAIDLGSALLGYPYVWGSQRYHWGNGKLNKNFVEGEFDCSALVQYVYYLSNGVILDVTTRTQVFNGEIVEREDLRRGDLMFFTNASRKNKTGVERIGHVGIYFGNNYILHTATDHAVIEPISSARWGYYITARRVV